MERWRRINVFVSLGGVLLCILSLCFVKYNPLIYCISAFVLGIAFKGFKNIYKNVEPPKVAVKNVYEEVSYTKKKKKKKKR